MTTNTKRCWPPEWIEAALRSGLAVEVNGELHFSSDIERDMLEEFAAGVDYAAVEGVTALQAENARMRDALESIQKHCEPHQSVLAIAVVATCRSGLRSNLSAGST